MMSKRTIKKLVVKKCPPKLDSILNQNEKFDM